MSTIEVFGTNGNKYLFNVYLVGERFNAVPGIYEFVLPARNSTSIRPLWDVLYIGETDNFHERIDVNLKQHHKYKYAINNGMTHLALHHFDGLDWQRKWIESDLIAAYNPPGNKIL